MTMTTMTIRHVAAGTASNASQSPRSGRVPRSGTRFVHVDEGPAARAARARAARHESAAALQDGTVAAPAGVLLHRMLHAALPVPAGHGAWQVEDHRRHHHAAPA